MIDPKQVCLFIPPNLRKFKLHLFEDIGKKIIACGGSIIRHDYEKIKTLPDEVIPIVGVSPQFRQNFAEWKLRGRNFIFWDRGYLRRVFATWMPTGHELGVPGGYYRWTLNDYQMQVINAVPDDRLKALKLHEVNTSVGVSQAYPWPWHWGKHILVADTGFDYWDVFADRNWVSRTVTELRKYTTREIIVRDKESRVPLDDQLREAHALVTHGSIAAVEAVMMGCPVFVDPMSAAALVGETDFSKIESPLYPDRTQWVHALAYQQWNEKELVDGTLWKQLS